VSELPEAYQKFIGPRGFVAPLVGEEFLSRWRDRKTTDLVDHLQGTFDTFMRGASRETALNLTAFVLEKNGAKAGSQELTEKVETPLRLILP
jgi:hypothetical protein